MIKILIGLMLLPCMLFSETYYVSVTTGAVSASGTREQPWKTISHAAETLKAGDTVVVEKYRERVLMWALLKLCVEFPEGVVACQYPYRHVHP